jgi:hypothetical protein
MLYTIRNENVPVEIDESPLSDEEETYLEERKLNCFFTLALVWHCCFGSS